MVPYVPETTFYFAPFFCPKSADIRRGTSAWKAGDKGGGMGLPRDANIEHQSRSILKLLPQKRPRIKNSPQVEFSSKDYPSGRFLFLLYIFFGVTWLEHESSPLAENRSHRLRARGPLTHEQSPHNWRNLGFFHNEFRHQKEAGLFLYCTKHYKMKLGWTFMYLIKIDEWNC